MTGAVELEAAVRIVRRPVNVAQRAPTEWAGWASSRGDLNYTRLHWGPRFKVCNCLRRDVR